VVSLRAVDLLSDYPSKSSRLRDEIITNGGSLVTEYFSQPVPVQGSFQERNRLITGMSQAVVLFQAAMKSGTMIYGRKALRQGKRLFVYPGPLGDPAYEGSRELIRQGAIPFREAQDIIAMLSGRDRDAANPQQDRPKTYFIHNEQGRVIDTGPILAALESEERPLMVAQPSAGGTEEEKLAGILSGGEKTMEQLSELSGISPSKLLSILTRMEIQGKVERVSGSRFRLVG